MINIAKLTCIIFFSVVVLCSCKNERDGQQYQIKSDTTKVFELAIKTAFNGYLPDVSSVHRKFYFKDSILLSIDPLLQSFVPQNVDSLKFKCFTEDKICNIIRADSLLENQPNYLAFRSFKKNDTCYYVQIASLSCHDFGGGGILGLYIFKSKDTFVVKHKMSSSIN